MSLQADLDPFRGASDPHDSSPRAKRARTGCLTCRARKIRCDETAGGCKNCEIRRVVCDAASLNNWAGRDGARPAESGFEILPGPGSSQTPTATHHPTRRLPACLPCRIARAKCSHERPRCTRCQRLKVDCRYPSLSPTRSLTQAAAARFQARTSITPAGRADTVSGTSETSPLPIVRVDSNATPTETSSDAAPGAAPTDASLRASLSTGLPESPLLDRLVDTFFECVYPYQANGYLHRGTLKQRIRDGEAPRMLLQAICAISVRFLPFDGPDRSREAASPVHARLWAQQATMDLMTNAEISCDTAAAALILAKDASYNGKWNNGISLGAVAARHAVQLNLFRETETERHGPQNWTEQETRRRIMFAAYGGNRKTAAGVPELAVCPASSMRIQLPCEEQNFDLAMPCATPIPTLEDEDVLVDPELYGSVGLMGHYIRLVGMRYLLHQWVNVHNSRVQDAQATGHRFSLEADRDLQHILRKLAVWKATLPARFHLTRENVFARHGTSSLGPFIMLHLWYDMLLSEMHNCVYEAYSLSVAVSTSETAAGAELAKSTCLAHATSIAYTLRLLHQNVGQDFTLLDSSFPALCFAAARLQLRHGIPDGFTQPLLGTAADIASNLRVLLGAMERTSTFFPSASMLMTELKRMIVVSGFDPWWHEDSAAQTSDVPDHPWLRRLKNLEEQKQAKMRDYAMGGVGNIESLSSDAELFSQLFDLQNWLPSYDAEWSSALNM